VAVDDLTAAPLAASASLLEAVSSTAFIPLRGGTEAGLIARRNGDRLRGAGEEEKGSNNGEEELEGVHILSFGECMRR